MAENSLRLCDFLEGLDLLSAIHRKGGTSGDRMYLSQDSTAVNRWLKPRSEHTAKLAS